MEAGIPYRDVDFGPLDLDIARRADGTLVIRSTVPLAEFDPNLLNALASQAQAQPDQTYLAERRGDDGAWHHQSYARARAQTIAIAQWLINLDLAPGRTVLIMSGNSTAHAMMKLGAMAAGVPVCPVSINYALLGGTYERLKHVIELTDPAVIFAEEGAPFDAALKALDLTGRTIVSCAPESLSMPAVSYDALVGTMLGPELERRITSLDTDAAAVYMLTSGSTGMPKAVIQTLRMITTNLVQAQMALGKTAGWHDVNLDWLPWNHVSGAFNMFAPILFGGTLYIDGGKPVAGLFDETLRNLRELSLPYFSNVPVGYAMLADALEKDEALCATFFKNLRLMLYGGAGLPQPLYDKIQALAVRTIGKRIFFTSGYGATETTSGCMVIYFDSDEVGIGLPTPGIRIKLIPLDDRYEIRMKGDNVTPGYLNMPELNAEIFDDEGYFRLGDAVRFNDPQDPAKGLAFAGRLAEEFKLSSGTWVAGGAVRQAVVGALAPVASDLLLCGADRSALGVLAVPHLEGLRQIAGDPTADVPTLITDAKVTAYVSKKMQAYNRANPGNSRRIACFRFMANPPRADRHEVSDKGAINQALTAANRMPEIETLYQEPPDDQTITL